MPAEVFAVTGLSDLKLRLVESLDDAQAFLRWLGQTRPILGLDIETEGLSYRDDAIRTVQFGDTREGWAIPYLEWRGVIRQALAQYTGPVVLHQAKFDASFLLRDGMPFPDWSRVHDTMLMCFLVNSQGPKGLKPAAALYVDPSARAGEGQLKAEMRANGWTWATIPVDHPTYWGYGAADTCLTAMLAEKLWPAVQPYREAYDTELACERVLLGMEMRGTRIDVEYARSKRARLATELDLMLEDLPVNPSAPADVAAWLVAQGVELTALTPTKKFSVTDSVLKELEHPIADLVLAARSHQKLISAYFDNFVSFADGDVLHPHINQLAARSGRMSVSEPALQQMPRSSLVRDAFIPRDGNKLLLIDYNNEELRLAAHFSQDPTMLAAFAEGRDLHMETARAAFGSDATKDDRNKGKGAMFAYAYGASAAKFASTLGISATEGQRIFQALEQTFPGLASIMSRVVQQVRARADDGDGSMGYVRLPDARRLRVPKDKAYVGLNYLIQGTGAIVLKRALIDLDAAGLGEMLNLPIHDEVMFDVPEADLDEVTRVAQEAMTRSDFTVPLTTSATVADRWGDPYRKEDE